MIAYELPMFPLEHPVLPGQLIPLQLFEPRYLALAEHLQGEVEADFGIVGIERGREVGGDDVRADVGVVVRVLEMTRLPDGRVSIVAVGTRRVKVNGVARRRPVPRAMVTDWPDDVIEDGLDVRRRTLPQPSMRWSMRPAATSPGSTSRSHRSIPTISTPRSGA